MAATCPPRLVHESTALTFGGEMNNGIALVIVDDPHTAHGRRMAGVVGATTPVVWLIPRLTLARDLASISLVVLAVPLRVRGGSTHDPFTRELVVALCDLRTRGGHVFVAQGPRPNPLAAAGTPVTGRPGAGSLSASEASVAAAKAAFLSLTAREALGHG